MCGRVQKKQEGRVSSFGAKVSQDLEGINSLGISWLNKPHGEGVCMNKCSMSSMSKSKVLHGGLLFVLFLFISTNPVASQSCLTTVMSKPSGPTQKYVLTFSNAPITGMAVCDRLIVSSGAVGPFSGHEDEYAYYVGGDPSLLSSWAFADPFDGDLAYVVAPDAKYYRFRSTGTIEWTALAFE